MENKNYYTYILKDSKLGIYKIGKSSDPIKRFKNLCRKGEIYPIALIAEDVENSLHKMFKENRTRHKDYTHNGGTEWFKRGGKFTEFIDEIDDGTVIPYLTIHSMIFKFVENKTIEFTSEHILTEVKEIDYGFHTLGITILSALGIIRVNKYDIEVKNKYKPHVLTIGKKIAIDDYIQDNISKYFKFYLAFNKLALTMLPEFDKDKNRSKIFKIIIDKSNIFPPYYLMINRIK